MKNLIFCSLFIYSSLLYSKNLDEVASAYDGTLEELELEIANNYLLGDKKEKISSVKLSEFYPDHIGNAWGEFVSAGYRAADVADYEGSLQFQVQSELTGKYYSLKCRVSYKGYKRAMSSWYKKSDLSLDEKNGKTDCKVYMALTTRSKARFHSKVPGNWQVLTRIK